MIEEARLFETIDQRQRVVLVHDRGRLVRSALVIDIDDLSSVGGITRTFERALEELIRRHGPPARTFEEGAFSADLARDLADGRLIRVAEWDIGRNVLRLGIPRRLDRQVRIEVHVARSFSPPRQTLWSIEGVR